jgi:hypothetical protein
MPQLVYPYVRDPDCLIFKRYHDVGEDVRLSYEHEKGFCAKARKIIHEKHRNRQLKRKKKLMKEEKKELMKRRKKIWRMDMKKMIKADDPDTYVFVGPCQAPMEDGWVFC